MDEKTQNGSETPAERELSTVDDAVFAEKVAERKTEISEDAANEPEHIVSEIKAPPFVDHLNDDTIPTTTKASENTKNISAGKTADTASADGFDTVVPAAGENETDTAQRQVGEAALNTVTDDLETGRAPDEARQDTRQESEEPGTESGHKASQLNPSIGDDAETTEKEAQRDNADNDHDEKGAYPEGNKTGLGAKSDSSNTDESEEIQGSSEEQTTTGKIDEQQASTDAGAGIDPAAQTQIESETADTDEETGDLAQGKPIETPAGRISTLKVTVSAIIITAVFSGFFFFDDNSKIKATSQKVSKTSEKREFSENSINQKKMIKLLTPKISSIYDAKIEEIAALRDSLLLKQEEVIRLKKQYREGIEELEKEISDELQKGESHTFLQAMENNSIAFTLRTIQRRQAYIQQLERPAKWIHQACEELLYIKRRILMDLQVAEIAGGIDMNKHVRHINAAVRKYQPTADKLAPEMTNAPLEPLEAIWERIQQKTQQYASVRAHSKNQIISEQICTGNFNRLTELSEISDETARCITEMQASDLFLNGLSEISPGAAKQLFHWKGSWICLNGVRALSPRAAHYLFQWDGNWISLNGLTEFPAEIGEMLLQWDGRQLELMGLQYLEDFPARIALEHLARWERAGGKLFVSQSVREKIDEIHTKSS